VVAPTAGTGVWVRVDTEVDLGFAFDFNKADAAVLYTVPTNAILHVRRGYWKVTTSFTGGASSAIGLSSSNAAYNTKGDLLGGAAGDVAAALTSGAPVRPGTIGAKTAAGVFLVGGDTIRFDRVTSAFTAGVGEAHLICDILANPGL
jgi:3-hydroxyisobutyrate dehydrogenase-like beta-hydroxyacid dehydrogenase